MYACLRLFSVIIVLPIFCYGGLQGPRHILNKRHVKSRAQSKTCQSRDCRNVTCDNADGWHIWGSGWGCCGNYDSCCVLASVVCYVHDVLCKCCDYGVLCGPTCKAEPDCPKINHISTKPEIVKETPKENNVEMGNEHIIPILNETDDIENLDGIHDLGNMTDGPIDDIQQDSADDSGSGETWFWYWNI